MEGQAEEDASAQAQAAASGETQNALDRAEEETFSNSEPEGDPESESESSPLVQSNEPEDDSGSDSEDSEDSDGELPLATKAEFTFQNLTTAEEWKTADVGNKWATPSATSVARCHRRRQNERIEKQKEETIQISKTYGSITRFFAFSKPTTSG